MARGQYQVAKASEATAARRRVFSVEHPTRQRFTKTDLAKFESTWDQLPHVVSRGAQKNFSDFTLRLGERPRTDPDLAYFERLVAKAILFRDSERIVQHQRFGGYRANIVTYTLALLSNATDRRLDLEKIWKQQALGETLERVIAELSHEVHAIITSPPNGRNITEWCKTQDCWKAVLENASTGAVAKLQDELMGTDAARRDRRRSLSELTDEYVENMRRVVDISSEGWRLLAAWGSETHALDVSETQMATRIGRALQAGRTVNSEDARRAVAVIDQAAQLGYRASA